MWIAILLLLIVALVCWTVTPTAVYNSQITITRTFTGGDQSADNTITVNGLNTTETGTSSSTPAVTKDADALVTMSGGAATFDLTSITDLLGLGTVTVTGLTPAYVKFVNPSTNANNITIAKGASNGYVGWGSAFSITLAPGGECLLKLAVSAVGSGSRTLDITGTLAQTLKVIVTAG